MAYKDVVLATTGLTSFWRLNEAAGATTAVDSQGTQNLTASAGGTTFGSANIAAGDPSDHSVALSGASGVYLVAPSGQFGFTGTTAFTVEGVFTFPTNIAANGLVDVWSNLGYNSGNQGVALWARNNGWGYYLHFVRANPSASDNLISFCPSASSYTPLATGSTHHIACTCDGTHMSMYVDGQKVAKAVITQTLGAQLEAFHIGSDGFGGNNAAMRAQDVAIYTVALSGATIRKHYYSSVAGTLTARATLFHGAWVPGGFTGNPSPQDTFNTLITNSGANTNTIKVLNAFTTWGPAGGPHNAIDPNFYATARRIGAIPMQTWEPHNGDPAEAAYKLTALQSGSYDSYIDSFATSLKALKYPIFLRFAQEMNNALFAWSCAAGNPNGNVPADYVAAWKYVRARFATLSANYGQSGGNVIWVWNPQTHFENSGTPTSSAALLGACFPGATFFDWLAMDGYNAPTTQNGAWYDGVDVFSQTYEMLRQLSTNSMFISETSSADGVSPFDKGTWVANFVGQDLGDVFPLVWGYVWFDENKTGFTNQYDWRVDSSSASKTAYLGAIAGTRLLATAPAPELTGVNPVSLPAGSTGQTVALTGFGFASGALAQWNGANRTTVINSPTSITMTLTTADLTTAGTYPITVTANGATSDPFGFVVGAAPANATLTSLSVGSGIAAQATDIANEIVAGSSIVNGGTCNWTGPTGSTTLSYTFQNSTQITATIPHSLLTTPGSATISYTNPGAAASNTEAFQVYRPPVVLVSVSPSAEAIGTAGPITLNLVASLTNGFGIDSSATVQYDGASRTLTWTDAQHASLVVTTADMASGNAGTHFIAVFNPGVAGSNTVTFTVSTPAAATITSLSQASALVGDGAFTLTVTGTNFLSGMTGQWDATTLTGGFVNGTTSTWTVPANLLTAGTHQVTVTNPGASASNQSPFVVSAPTAYPAAVLGTAGVQHYWRLTDPAGQATAFDHVGNAPATVSGSWTFGGAGAYPSDAGTSAALASGTGKATTSAQLPADAAATTLEAWAKPTVAAKMVIVATGGTTADTGFALGVDATGHPYLSFGTDDLVAPAALATGWHHLVGVWDQSAALQRLYVDSVQVGTRAPTGSPAAPAAIAHLGEDTSGAERYAGSLQDIAVYTVALTQAQVTAHYAASGSAVAPQLTALSPNPLTPGTAGTLTVTAGSPGFAGTGSVVSVDGATQLTTFVDSAHVTIAYPANEAPGTHSVTATNPGSAASNSLGWTVYSPPAVLSAVVPASTPIGSGLTTVNLVGSGFDPAMTATLGGLPRPLSGITATGAVMTLTEPNDTTTAGDYAVVAHNPNVAASNAATFSVAPRADSLSPASGVTGAAGTLTVVGDGFAASSTIVFDGVARTTAFVDAQHISFDYPNNLAAGNHTVQVRSASGVVSNTLTWPMSSVAPTITGVTPNPWVEGTGGLLTVTGTNFVAASVVAIDGVAQTTHVFSSTQLTVALPTSGPYPATEQPGAHTITVVNP